MIEGLLLASLVLAIGITALIYKQRAERRRRLELASLALQMGFSYTPARDEGFAAGWGFLKRLALGKERYAFNILRGEFQGQAVFAFDYHYLTGSDDDKKHHYVTFVMLVVREAFPLLSIRPETLMTKVAGAFGFEDINFESAEFSRAFCVRSEDKKFAYDVCNPQMIEYLLANRDLEIEIQGPVLLLAFASQLPVEQIAGNLQRLAEIRSRLPEYLFTKV